MSKYVTINGTAYKVDDLDFTNVVCDLEEQGIDVFGIMDGSSKQYMTLCRAFIMIVTHLPAPAAGKLLTKHIRNGGKLDEILDSFKELMNDAGFGEAETAETAAPQAEAVPDKQ